MMIELIPLSPNERESFIIRNQTAFKKAAMEEFGPQTDEVISREDILSSLNTDTAEAFNIVVDGDIVGGVVVQIDKESGHNSLDLLFIDPAIQGKNIGCTVWKMIEEKYPETKIWETHTPYFEIRNIHFYVNKCGFHIVEFFNPKHPDPHEANTPGGELFFRFEKQMKQT